MEHVGSRPQAHRHGGRGLTITKHGVGGGRQRTHSRVRRGDAGGISRAAPSDRTPTRCRPTRRGVREGLRVRCGGGEARRRQVDVAGHYGAALGGRGTRLDQSSSARAPTRGSTDLRAQPRCSTATKSADGEAQSSRPLRTGRESRPKEGLIRIFRRRRCLDDGTCGACLGGHMGVLGEGEVVSAPQPELPGPHGPPKAMVYLSEPGFRHKPVRSHHTRRRS